jgi:hypothetical protein
MRTAQTQLAAYDALTAPKISASQQIVLALFAGHAITLTRQEIATRAKLPLASVCGRVRELLDAEVLVVRGSRKCIATGQSNQTVGLPVDVAATA